MAQLYEVSQDAHLNDLSLPLQSEAWKGYMEGISSARAGVKVSLR